MEPNNPKPIFSQPRVIIGGLISLAAIGGVSTAIMQPTTQPTTQQTTTQRDIGNGTSTLSPKADRLTTQPNQEKSVDDIQEKSNNISDKSSRTDSSANSSTSLDQPQKVKDTDPSSSGVSGSNLPANPDNGNLNQVERCETTMAKISDPNPPANVRSQPNAANGPIVGNLANGTFVTVIDSSDSWFKISTPTKGWISKSIALSGCNQKEERVNFAKGSTITTIADEFIGTGSHVYKLSLAKGQTLRLRSSRGPRPTLISPQGQTLTSMSDDVLTWSGKLDQSGDYRFILDSNFKGYRYAFEVGVQ